METMQIRQLIESYKPSDTREHISRAATLHLLQNSAPAGDPCSRHHHPGHLTASAFVLNPSLTKVLLVRHAILHRLFQPGGHVEAEDRSLAEAALREVREETGIRDARLLMEEIFDMDVHVIPPNPRRGEPEHAHHDIRFLIVAQDEQVFISDESTEIVWFDLADPALREEESIARMVRKWMALSSRFSARLLEEATA